RQRSVIALQRGDSERAEAGGDVVPHPEIGAMTHVGQQIADAVVLGEAGIFRSRQILGELCRTTGRFTLDVASQLRVCVVAVNRESLPWLIVPLQLHRPIIAAQPSSAVLDDALIE